MIDVWGDNTCFHIWQFLQYLITIAVKSGMFVFSAL